jgi:hypothetical protein
MLIHVWWLLGVLMFRNAWQLPSDSQIILLRNVWWLPGVSQFIFKRTLNDHRCSLSHDVEKCLAAVRCFYVHFQENT